MKYLKHKKLGRVKVLKTLRSPRHAKGGVWAVTTNGKDYHVIQDTYVS